jgi:hypothetical protein
MIKKKDSIELQKFRAEAEEWEGNIGNLSLIKILNEKLKELEPDRGLDAIKELKNAILGHCYCSANPDNVPGGDWSDQLREEDKIFIESAPSILNKIDELTTFITSYPASDQTLEFDLANALNKYSSDIKERSSGLREKKFAHWQQYGALYYPDRLTPQAQKKHPQLNSIIFSVVFLIRQYTDKSVPGDNWLKIKCGPMPKDGIPHYELAAQIVNATNEISNPRFRNKSITGEQVKFRIKRLVDNNVQLSILIAPQYFAFLNCNRIPLK